MVNENKKDDRSFSKARTLALSITIAIILWVAIVNVVNPDVTETFHNIPVQANGIGNLRDKGFVMVNADKLPKCSVKVRGKRKDIIEAKDKIYAVINVSDINQEGKREVTVIINSPSSINIEKQSITTVSAEIEVCHEKDIPIYIKQENVPEGKIIESVATDGVVRISGSRQDIDKVSGCFVVANLADLKENSKIMYPFTYLSDENTQIVKPSTIYSSAANLVISHTIYDKKNVKLNIEVPKEVSDSYRIDVEELSGKEIVCGVDNKNKDVEEIKYTLSSENILEGENKIDLTEQLPEGIYIPENQRIIKFDVKSIISKKVSVEVSEYNLKDGFKVSDIQKDGTYSLKGTEEELQYVKGKVNVENLEAGTYQLPLEFEDENITPAQKYFVTAVIERKED